MDAILGLLGICGANCAEDRDATESKARALGGPVSSFALLQLQTYDAPFNQNESRCFFPAFFPPPTEQQTKGATAAIRSVAPSGRRPGQFRLLSSSCVLVG